MQTDKVSAKMEKTAEQEGAYGQRAGGANQTKGGGVLRSNEQQAAFIRSRNESYHSFLGREQAEGRIVRTVDGVGYGYRPVPIETQTEYKKQILLELQGPGVNAFAYNGELRANIKRKTMVDVGEAATLRDGSVGIPNRRSGGLTAKEIAAHDDSIHYIKCINLWKT